MTAATITPAAIVGEAHAALHLAMEKPWRETVRAEIITLACALGAYAELDGGALDWDADGSGAAGDAGPGELLRLAEEAETAAGALIAAMAAHAAKSGAEDIENAIAGVAAK